MAKTGSFRCPKCDRRFRMAAHLARHMSTTHAARGGTARKKSAKRGRQRGGARRKVAAASRRSTTGVAASALDSLRRYHQQLSEQRETLDARIVAIEGALAALCDG